MSPRRGAEIGDPTLIRCSECGREAIEFEAMAERWTFWSVGVGEIGAYCSECAQRKLGFQPMDGAGQGAGG